MNRAEKNALFEALYNPGDPPDRKTRVKAFRRLLTTPDGLILIKTFSPCLQTLVNTLNGESLSFREGRRSLLLEIVKTALREDEGEADGRDN